METRQMTLSFWRLVSWVRSLYLLNRNHIKRALRKRKWVLRGDVTSLPEEVTQKASCVFVLSTGRCGTELLTRLIEMGDNAEVYHTPKPELVYLAKLAYLKGSQAHHCFKVGILHARYEMVRDAYLRGALYVETNNAITFHAPFLAEVFQQSKFIHLIRDPAAFVRSGLRRGYYNGSSYDEGRIVPRAGSPLIEQWPELSQVEKVAWLWNETNQFIQDFKAQIDPDRVLTVYSESLFGDPSESERIFDFMGLSCPSKKKVVKRIARPTNVERTTSVAPYSEWREEDRAAVRRFAMLATDYGYEL